MRIVHIVAPFVFFAILATIARAQPAVVDFYRGKIVTIVVGQPSGSTFDSYARLIAGHLSKHVPGRPAIILQNMPGAASLVGGVAGVCRLAGKCPR